MLEETMIFVKELNLKEVKEEETSKMNIIPYRFK